MPTAARTQTTSADATGSIPSKYPAATPAKAACPIPSPIRLMRRCTRKKPTAGARSPTTAPAAKARRMKSASRMDMRRVMPGIRELGRRPVVEDLPAHEHEPLDEGLDGAELMGDVDDRHPQLPVQLAEERCE